MESGIIIHEIPVINISHGPLRRSNTLAPKVIKTLQEIESNKNKTKTVLFCLIARSLEPYSTAQIFYKSI